jgi:hypothetical protein
MVIQDFVVGTQGLSVSQALDAETVTILAVTPR